MTFSDQVLVFIQPGFKVLDLGAGKGWFSRKCLEKQAIVTAVDRSAPENLSPGIDWHTMDVKEFVERLPEKEVFDIIYSRNLIQFLDSDWVEKKLIPTLIEHLRPAGIIAIQTFYQDPEPPFESKVPSIYTVDDLRTMLAPLQILQAKGFSDNAPDMAGIPRTFFLTNIIAKKVQA